MKPTISIIAALSENRVIGNQDKIPWRIKEDLVRFKEKTLGHVTIVGRKTFDSLIGYYERSGKPFPDRTHIIITLNPNYKTDVPQTHIVHSLGEALTKAQELEQEEIFIAGGGQIFEQALPFTDKLYLTIVKGNFVGDAFFPDYSEFKKEVFREEHKNENHEFTFVDLTRN